MQVLRARYEGPPFSIADAEKPLLSQSTCFSASLIHIPYNLTLDNHPLHRIAVSIELGFFLGPVKLYNMRVMKIRR